VTAGRSGSRDPSGDADPALPFEQLDYLYMPSRDVAADVAHFTKVLGARIVFAIDDGGTRVAMLELTDGPPRILLTDHVAGDAPILVYRVANIEATVRTLQENGWSPSRTLEIPQGPVASFRAPGGQRIAAYERTRPEVEAHFIGRRDF
jgi:hypothetical protein